MYILITVSCHGCTSSSISTVHLCRALPSNLAVAFCSSKFVPAASSKLTLPKSNPKPSPRAFAKACKQRCVVLCLVIAQVQTSHTSACNMCIESCGCNFRRKQPAAVLDCTRHDSNRIMLNFDGSLQVPGGSKRTRMCSQSDMLTSFRLQCFWNARS